MGSRVRKWHHLVPLLLLAMFYACSNDPTGPAEQTTMLSEDAVVVDESSDLAVIEVEATRIVYDAHLADPEHLPFAEGDIIISAQDGGYLRRISSLEVLGDSLLVQTEHAVLAEVILEGGFSWSGPLEFDLSPRRQKGGTTYVHPALKLERDSENNGLSFSIDGFVMDLGSGAAVEVQAGSFHFAPEFDIGGRFDHGVQEFHAIVNGELNFDVLAEVTLTATTAGQAEVELISDLRASAPIHVQAGAVPILIYPEFDLLVGFETSASATTSLTGGVETDNFVETGFWWTDEGGFETVYERTFRGEASPLELSSQVEQGIRIYFKPRLSFMVYTVAGPYIALEPYASEVGTTHPSPQDEYCTEWSLGLSGEVGANLEILDWGFSANLDLVDWSVVLEEECVDIESPGLTVTCSGADFTIMDRSGHTLGTGSVGTMNSPYWPDNNYTIVDHAIGNIDDDSDIEVVFIARHSPWFPGQVVAVDLDGTILGRYWNPGHVFCLTLHDHNLDGVEEIYVGATNNDYFGGGFHAPVVVSLDARTMNGEAPPRYGRIGTGTERWYAVCSATSSGAIRQMMVSGTNIICANGEGDSWVLCMSDGEVQ